MCDGGMVAGPHGCVPGPRMGMSRSSSRVTTTSDSAQFAAVTPRSNQVGQKILGTFLDMLPTFWLEFEIFALVFRGHRIHQSKGAIMEMAIYFWLRIAPGHHVTQARE